MDDDRRLITIINEEGEEEVLELLDFVEYNNNMYGVFTPYIEDESDDDDGEIDAIVFHVLEENGEFSFVAEDDETNKKVLELFVEGYEAEYESGEN